MDEKHKRSRRYELNQRKRNHWSVYAGLRKYYRRYIARRDRQKVKSELKAGNEQPANKFHSGEIDWMVD